MPKVWNKRDPNVPKDAIYVGRPSAYGNPYVIGKHGTRTEVICKFRADMETLRTNCPKLYRQMADQLRGKDLVCWCAPAACHADVLLEIANPEMMSLGD